MIPHIYHYIEIESSYDFQLGCKNKGQSISFRFCSRFILGNYLPELNRSKPNNSQSSRSERNKERVTHVQDL